MNLKLRAAYSSAVLLCLYQTTLFHIPEAQNVSIVYHHHVAAMEVGHLLTHFGLTYPDVSSLVFLGSFCLLVCTFAVSWVICYGAFCLHVVSSFSCSSVFCPKLGLYLIPFQFLYLSNDLSKCVLPFFSCISSLLLFFFLCLLS
jgi:hypothetical protein